MGMSTEEYIQSLKDRVFSLEKERDSLREQLRVMQEPVSDEEWKAALRNWVAVRISPRQAAEGIIAARAAKAKENACQNSTTP